MTNGVIHVKIVGFVTGYHHDAKPSDRGGDTILAIFIKENGEFGSGLLRELKQEVVR